MFCTLYVPYSIGDPEKGFKYNGGEEISDRKYTQLVIDDYNAYKDSVGIMLNNAYYANNNSFVYGLSNNNFAKRNFMSQYSKNGYTHQDYEFYTCKCQLFNMDNKDENIDMLLKYYKNNEQFIEILEMQNLSQNPDLETEFKMWIKESTHINNSRRLSDEEKIYNLPKKDLKIIFDKSTSSAILKECKIMEVYNASCYAILINKIYFTDKK